ncbi:MAG: hypothetical protein ACYDEJ_17030 [Desulfitobacteriaceae bacterium]
MNRRFYIIVVVILFVLLGTGYWVSSQNGEKTIEEAIEKTGRRGSSIIYQEEVNGGIVVFTKRTTGDAYVIDSGFIKKGLLGWKWIWGGGYSGYYGQYFQAISGTPFPMLFGDINNEQITKVNIKDVEHNNSKEAKIVGNCNDRIWFTFLNKYDGPSFEIITLSQTGKVLDSKNIDIRNDTNF